MTLIAIARRDDSIEFLTDSVSYSPHCSSIGAASKSVLLPHLDAAVVTQGDARFCDDAKAAMLQTSSQVDTFDHMVAMAPRILQSLWEGRQAEPGEPRSSCIHLVGYSRTEDRFVATGHASPEGFLPFAIESFWMFPSTWGVRPNDYETSLLRRVLGGDRPDLEDVLADWATKPAPPLPESVDQWRTVARWVREDRSTVTSYARCFIGGPVILTRLELGSAHVERIHEFDTTLEEIQELVAGTWHPLGQVVPCPCGSGVVFRDCCLVVELDDVCDCGSGKPLRECHMVSDEVLATSTHQEC